ncbi:MAG: carbohydrate kinase [Candidatus Aenigmarchaeota archaeon]|nr:carbohydrate kinase [Candidatus Aenigmarchaeota archaeon]
MSMQVCCMGELIVDMIASESGRLERVSGFLKNFGGAPANTAIGLAKLGVKVGYIGKVGNDPFGDFLVKTLQENGVDVSGIVKDEQARTTLAFVCLTEDGERDFTFYRNPGADEQLSSEDVKEEFLTQAKIFHFGSLLQIRNPSRKATEKALKIAKKNITFISYDPNYRESLWKNKNLAKETIFSTIPHVSFLKVSEEELEILTGTKNPERAIEKLPVKNQLIVVTLGKKGCYYYFHGISNYVKGFKVNVMDTTGAGDAFNAGALYGILPFVEKNKVSQLDKQELDMIFKQANLVAAVTTTKKGAITAFPSLDELENYRR